MSPSFTRLLSAAARMSPFDYKLPDPLENDVVEGVTGIIPFVMADIDSRLGQGRGLIAVEDGREAGGGKVRLVSARRPACQLLGC